MKGAILQSVELLKEGKFEEIQKTIEDSLKISTEQDMGHDYFDSFKSRQQVHSRICIPTGFPLLDANEVLDGGLANGELGVVMAPTGGGKSFFLVNLGFGALAAGKNVIHYTFELSETHVGNRYDSRITGIPTKELRKRMSEAEDGLSTFNGGQLFIKEYPPKVATINTIKFHMGRLLSNGFNPDLARPLVVAIRPKALGGEYVIVDGQHTACLAAVYLAGDGEQEIPCQIPEVLQHPESRTLEECIQVESDFFDKLNYLRNNPSAIARLRAGVARKDKKALEWEETFQSIGIHVEKVGDPDGHSVFGLAKLKTCINKYGSTYTKQAVETYANTIKYSTSDTWNNPLQGGLVLGLAAAYHFADNYAGDGTTKDGFLEFLESHLSVKTPKEWTEKTSGVIMDILIVEDKLVDGYNSAVGFGVIKAPKIGEKRLLKWKADPIHAKGSKDNNDDD